MGNRFFGQLAVQNVFKKFYVLFRSIGVLFYAILVFPLGLLSEPKGLVPPFYLRLGADLQRLLIFFPVRFRIPPRTGFANLPERVSKGLSNWLHTRDLKHAVQSEISDCPKLWP